MTIDEKKATATRVAWAFVGTPYIWGGDDPSGFDCSGLCIEILQSVGILPRAGDWSAAQLEKRFKPTVVPHEGCLAFWRNAAGAVVHVEYLISDELAIGASGGDSDNTSVDAAWRENAYVKARPFATRGGKIGFADPFA